jgi:hypothetical protein
VKNEQYDGTEMVRVLLARGADQAQLAEVEPLLNKTMQYWRLRAQERRPFQQRMLKAFKLEGLREVEFAVVGQQAATTAISNQIMTFVGQRHAVMHGKPLVIFIPGAPGHGKTYFTKNLTKALVGEENFLFVPFGDINSSRELFGVQWGSTSDDGRITSFLKARQDKFSVVMLDDFDKFHHQSKGLSPRWDQSKPIYQSFLEPWLEGTIRYKGGVNASASDDRGRTIRCGKCIFICTTNLCQQEIVDFTKLPAHQRRMSERMGEQDIQWIDRELVQKTIKPNLIAFFKRIHPELQALVRRCVLIAPFVPLTPAEQAVVADMELRRFFEDTPVAVPAPEAPEWGGVAAGSSEPLAGAVAAAVACAAPPAAPPASAVSAGAGGDGSSSSSDDEDARQKDNVEGSLVQAKENPAPSGFDQWKTLLGNEGAAGEPDYSDDDYVQVLRPLGEDATVSSDSDDEIPEVLGMPISKRHVHVTEPNTTTICYGQAGSGKAVRNTLVARNLDEASAIAYKGKRTVHQVVTLQGEIISTSGTMAGGGAKAHSGGMKAQLAAEPMDAVEHKALERGRDDSDDFVII